MKFVNNALLLILVGSSTVSAKLNSPNRDLQIAGIIGGDNETTSLLGGLAETVGGAVETISGFVGENATLSEVSIEGAVNSTTDFIAGVVNTTTGVLPDLNGTLDGFMPELGIGPVIPGESNETVTPETLPAGSTVAPETLPAETGSTVSAGATDAAVEDEGMDDHDEEDGHDHTDTDALEGDDAGDSATGVQVGFTVASIVSVGLLLNAF